MRHILNGNRTTEIYFLSFSNNKIRTKYCDFLAKHKNDNHFPNLKGNLKFKLNRMIFLWTS